MAGPLRAAPEKSARAYAAQFVQKDFPARKPNSARIRPHKRLMMPSLPSLTVVPCRRRGLLPP